MRISDRLQTPVVHREPQPLRPSSASATSSNVEVNVSKRAERLACGVERIAELRAAVRDGTFRVDASAIAARLVGDDDVGGAR